MTPTISNIVENHKLAIHKLRQKDETKVNTLDDLVDRSSPNFVSQYLTEVLELTPVN
jgi:hypothetical protein